MICTLYLAWDNLQIKDLVFSKTERNITLSLHNAFLKNKLQIEDFLVANMSSKKY